mgnify:CR=1 FL=1
MTGAEIQVNSMLQCGDGIVFAPNEGNKRSISNVFVTHVTATNVSEGCSESPQRDTAACRHSGGLPRDWQEGVKAGQLVSLLDADFLSVPTVGPGGWFRNWLLRSMQLPMLKPAGGQQSHKLAA